MSLIEKFSGSFSLQSNLRVRECVFYPLQFKIFHLTLVFLFKMPFDYETRHMHFLNYLRFAFLTLFIFSTLPHAVKLYTWEMMWGVLQCCSWGWSLSIEKWENFKVWIFRRQFMLKLLLKFLGMLKKIFMYEKFKFSSKKYLTPK